MSAEAEALDAIADLVRRYDEGDIDDAMDMLPALRAALRLAGRAA